MSRNDATWSAYQRHMADSAELGNNLATAQLVATFRQTNEAREHSRQQVSAMQRTEAATREVAAEVRGTTVAVEAVGTAVRDGAEIISRNLFALTGAMNAGFDGIGRALVGQMELQQEQLDLTREILRTTKNPRRSAALELFQDALRLLHQGHVEEAARDLRRAVEQRPQEARAQLALGMASAAQGNDPAAIEAFGAALKFADADPESDGELAPAIAASAALQLKAIGAAGADAAVAQALRVAPHCAELWLAQAEISGDQAALERALRIAPELAVVAVSARIAGAEDVATQVYDDPEGPIQSMLEAIRAAPAIGATATQPADLPSAMILHRRWVTSEFMPVYEAARAAVERFEAAQEHHNQTLEHDERAESLATKTLDDREAAEAAAALARQQAEGAGALLPRSAAVKPLAALVVTIVCAFAAGPWIVVAVIGAYLTYRWGKAWRNDVEVAKAQQRARLGAASHQADLAAADADEARSIAAQASDLAGEAAAREAAAFEQLNKATVAREAALVVIGRTAASIPDHRTRPLFL